MVLSLLDTFSIDNGKHDSPDACLGAGKLGEQVFWVGLEVGQYDGPDLWAYRLLGGEVAAGEDDDLADGRVVDGALEGFPSNKAGCAGQDDLHFVVWREAERSWGTCPCPPDYWRTVILVQYIHNMHI